VENTDMGLKDIGHDVGWIHLAQVGYRGGLFWTW